MESNIHYIELKRVDDQTLPQTNQMNRDKIFIFLKWVIIIYTAIVLVISVLALIWVFYKFFSTEFSNNVQSASGDLKSPDESQEQRRISENKEKAIMVGLYLMFKFIIISIFVELVGFIGAFKERYYPALSYAIIMSLILVSIFIFSIKKLNQLEFILIVQTLVTIIAIIFAVKLKRSKTNVN